MINTKMSPAENKQLQKMIKTKTPNKLVNPKEKIGDKIPKNFNARTS